MKRPYKTWIALSIIPQILIIKMLSFFPYFVETIYSQGIYIFISKLMRFALGWIPFSIGDVIYTLGGIYLIYWLISRRKHLIQKPLILLRDIMVAVSLIYFSFHLLWGMNYYRLPLHEKLNLEADYTTEELIQTIDALIPIANRLHSELTKNKNEALKMPYEREALISESYLGYKSLPDSLGFLDPHPISIKASLYSIPLTYMGFSGYLNPFTHEANVDYIIPAHKLPTTSAHEMAHQIGYAAENEANFIGFLSGINHPDKYHRYSAFTFGLKHCLFELGRRNPEAFERKKEELNEGILKNYRQERIFWNLYENPMEPFFKATFNKFLIINNQRDGIKSYSYVVALIVNYYEANLE